MPAETMTHTDADTLQRLNRDYITSVRTSDVRRFEQILAEDFLPAGIGPIHGCLGAPPGPLARRLRPRHPLLMGRRGAASRAVDIASVKERSRSWHAST